MVSTNLEPTPYSESVPNPPQGASAVRAIQTNIDAQEILGNTNVAGAYENQLAVAKGESPVSDLAQRETTYGTGAPPANSDAGQGLAPTLREQEEAATSSPSSSRATPTRGDAGTQPATGADSKSKS